MLTRRVIHKATRVMRQMGELRPGTYHKDTSNLVGPYDTHLLGSHRKKNQAKIEDKLKQSSCQLHGKPTVKKGTIHITIRTNFRTGATQIATS